MKKTFVAGLAPRARHRRACAVAQEAATGSPQSPSSTWRGCRPRACSARATPPSSRSSRTTSTPRPPRSRPSSARWTPRIKTLQDELEKQGAVLSQEARDKKQQEIVRKSRERQAFLEDGQAEINRMRERAQQQAQSINNEFQLKIRPIVEQVAKDKGFDLVLDSQVAYTINKDFDITRDVIVKADEAEKAKPRRPPRPPPAPKP